jgi:hypothetical protein
MRGKCAAGARFPFRGRRPRYRNGDEELIYTRCAREDAMICSWTNSSASSARSLTCMRVTSFKSVRDEVLMVTLMPPGRYLEVEFFNDGRIEIERFVTQGVDQATRSDLESILSEMSS